MCILGDRKISTESKQQMVLDCRISKGVSDSTATLTPSCDSSKSFQLQ